MIETWVTYVDLRLKNAASGNAGAGINTLREGYTAMLQDGWRLTASVPDIDTGTTVGAWMLFERMGDVTDQADRILASANRELPLDLSETREGPV